MTARNSIGCSKASVLCTECSGENPSRGHCAKRGRDGGSRSHKQVDKGRRDGINRLEVRPSEDWVRCEQPNPAESRDGSADVGWYHRARCNGLWYEQRCLLKKIG